MTLSVTVIILSYLLGSIPFGLLISRARGIDVRREGSGNIGATNVLRSVGKKEAGMTLAADALKGMIPVLLIQSLTGDSQMAALAGVAAVTGHIFPLFLKFKGGKGVATALGVMAYMTPKATLVAVMVFAVVTFVSKYVSLGSVSAAVAIPLSAWFFSYEPLPVFATGLISLMVIIRHHQNIGRLLAGTENRLGQDKNGDK